jgi:hypothetical protein
MAAKIFRINYKSDFILTMNSDAGWAIPFCIKFWTSVPSRAYFVGFDGTTYTHCAYDPSEPTKLVVQFDDHHLPIGDLNYQIAYHFTVSDFPNDTEDEVINPAAITTEIDGDTYHVMLDFTGETAPEIEFSLPAYANEAERIQNELQRQQNEADRIAAELQREQATAAAVQGAENVNAQLNGTTLTVTNRQGVSTSVNTKGEPGAQGPVGPEGPQGEQGVSIVSFRQVYASETATYYSIAFSDGHEQSVAIPKGEKGDTGATGPQGPQGPQGDTGVSITGFVETGETTTATLYNITFSNGTTQAVAIPKGEQGDQGPVGPQGPQGPMGDVAVITPEQQAAFTMYSEPGQNTNGPMTQKAVTDALVAGSISYDNSQSGLTAENVQGALDEVDGKIGDVDPVSIQLTVISSSRYIINNGQVVTGSNSTCKRAEPIDVSSFAKVKASFYLEQSYSSVSVFADDDGNVVGDKIVNDGQNYLTFNVPEGATKLYLCTRENPVTGVYDPFGAIGITGKSVTDRLDELDDELTNFEVVTKNLSVPSQGTDKTNFPFVEGRTYRIKTTRTSGTAALSINAYESLRGGNAINISQLGAGKTSVETIYVANSYQYIGLWCSAAVGVSVEISWENGRKIELIEDEIDELKEDVLVSEDTGFNPNGELVKTGTGISTNASFTLGQYSLIGTVETSHVENNISGITCNTALLEAGKTYKVEFDYDTDFDTSMQFRDSSLQNPLRVVSIPEGTGSISTNVTTISDVGVIAFFIPSSTTGSFTLTNFHIYEEKDVQWAYDKLSETIASYHSIDSEGIDLKVSEFAKGQGETDNDVWDKILLFSSVVKSRTIHIDRNMDISRVLLVPSNTTILIEDSTIICGNNFADNVFRGANEDASYVARVEAAATVNDCPTEIEEIENIRILGVGSALITRTDTNNYIGTDNWGWKTINVYFDRLKHAEIGNITFRKTRGWNMCFFFGSDIYIHDVNVYSNNIYNGDGMDFRAGCHHITIENLYGQTRDDNIALHCMKSQGRKTSNNIWPCLCSGYIAAVAATDARACDIHDVKIDGSTKDGRDGGASWHNVMFVARSGTEIYNVSLRNIRTYGPIIEATQEQYGGGAIYFEDFTVPSLDDDRPDNVIHDVCIINASNSDNAQYPTVKSQLKCENIYLKDITTSVSGQVAISLDYPEGFTVID